MNQLVQSAVPINRGYDLTGSVDIWLNFNIWAYTGVSINGDTQTWMLYFRESPNLAWMMFLGVPGYPYLKKPPSWSITEKQKGSYWRVTSQPPSITKKGSQQEVTIELTENSSGE